MHFYVLISICVQTESGFQFHVENNCFDSFYYTLIQKELKNCNMFYAFKAQLFRFKLSKSNAKRQGIELLQLSNDSIHLR